MKKLTIIFAATAICFAAATDTFAQKGKPTPTPSLNIPISAQYEQFGADGTLNRVTMDNNVSPYTHGVDNVSALFQIDNSSRDLTINLRNSANRSVQFDLSQVTGATAANAPGWNYQPQLFKTGMNVIGAYWAKETCQPDVNGVYNCDHEARITTIGISVSGYPYNYRLLWNPTPENPSPANEPEATSYVNVNYQRDESGNDVFTITPKPNASGKRLAGLEATYTGKGKASVTNAGQYEMPFTLVVRPL